LLLLFVRRSAVLEVVKRFQRNSLGAIAMQAAVAKAGIKPEQVQDVLMGCVIRQTWDRRRRDRLQNLPDFPMK
jgi:acetyl-CoA acetyltransferase